MGRAYCIPFGAGALTLELDFDAELAGPPGAEPVRDDEAATIRQALEPSVGSRRLKDTLMPDVNLSIAVSKEMSS